VYQKLLEWTNTVKITVGGWVVSFFRHSEYQWRFYAASIVVSEYVCISIFGFISLLFATEQYCWAGRATRQALPRISSCIA